MKWHKVFNYFNIVHENYLVTMAHLDVGLMRVAFVNVRDMKTGEVQEIKIDDFLSDKVHIDYSKIGDEIYSSI